MELTEKNGHASIEEILASVRRIIAEEPGQSAPVIDLGKPAQYPRGDGLLDDPSDFDLPSMFKTQPAVTANEKPAPLFGRLSEAIRAASTGNGQNGDRAEQALSTLKLHRVEATDSASASHFLLSTFHEATAPRVEDLAAGAAMSTAATVQPAVTAVEVAAEPVLASTPSDPVAKPAQAEPAPLVSSHSVSPPASPQVPRQMAAFKDTRFRGMGSSPAPIAAPMQPAASPFEDAATAALVQASAAPIEMPTPAAIETDTLPVLVAGDPAHAADDFVAVEAPQALAAAIVASYPALGTDPAPAEPLLAEPSSAVAHQAALPVPPQHVPPPVPVVEPPSSTNAAAAPIEDSTADLLRPMLRQWLAENMPRMVEKALHIEVAESGKTTKK